MRHIGTPKVRDAESYFQALTGKRALEIGGPSDFFCHDGALPVYPILASVDNCLFSCETMWTGKIDGRFYYDAQRREGIQFVCEVTALEPIGDASYDCVLASHCLEHTANPLKALQEFRRILKPGGLLLAILPNMDDTFDWRRPLTPLSHMQEDYAKDTSEDDLSHLSEILSLHDMRKDTFPGTIEEFRERCRQNHKFRIMHHHTFNPSSAGAFLESGGFRILRTETVKPYNITILAQLD